MAGAKERPRQMQLHLPTWGGRRKRKRRRGDNEPRKLRKVPHRKRPALAARFPVLVTWRVLPHVWNLRSRRCFEPCDGSMIDWVSRRSQRFSSIELSMSASSPSPPGCPSLPSV